MGQIVPLSAALRQRYQDIADGLARQGDQVQALAQLRLPADQFPVGFAFDVDRPNFPLVRGSACALSFPSFRS